MNICGVTVCVNYGDFLAHTLPQNKTMFDKMVVVTDHKDIQTQRLCEYHKVTCIKTDAFYSNGDKFNKAKGINVGLKALDSKDWVCHFDADIYLPRLTREILQTIHLDKDSVYGLDRLMVNSFEDWMDYITYPDLIQEAGIYIHPTKFKTGVRISQYEIEGYIPIGFFQLWNIQSGITTYPDTYDGADRTDMQFAKQFSKDKRRFIPDISVLHLDSQGDDIKQSANWWGRKTPWFGLKDLRKTIKKDLDKLVLNKITTTNLPFYVEDLEQ